MKRTLEELLQVGGVYHKNTGNVTVKYGKHTINVWAKGNDGLYKNVDCYSIGY